MSYTIHVSGLAPQTSDTTLHDFFSCEFDVIYRWAILTVKVCGKLTSVKKSGTEADITFEKQSAMRTAL